MHHVWEGGKWLARHTVQQQQQCLARVLAGDVLQSMQQLPCTAVVLISSLPLLLSLLSRLQ